MKICWHDNYNSLITKTKNVLRSWTNRGLSIIGRITVVNTLVASLFVYKMMVLPSLTDTLIKNFETIITQYIWDNKKSKIALKTLQASKSVGGLKLTSLKLREKALKLTWPQILSNETAYAETVYQKIHPLKSLIWKCNINPVDVPELKIPSKFWSDVVTAWADLNFYLNIYGNTTDQILWLNSRIKIDNKLIFWGDCYRRGLVYVKQLFCNGKVKSFINLYNEYGLDAIRLNSIFAAIPKDWRMECVTLDANAPMKPHNYDYLIGKKHLAAYAYEIFVKELDEGTMNKRGDMDPKAER